MARHEIIVLLWISIQSSGHRHRLNLWLRIWKHHPVHGIRSIRLASDIVNWSEYLNAIQDNHSRGIYGQVAVQWQSTEQADKIVHEELFSKDKEDSQRFKMRIYSIIPTRSIVLVPLPCSNRNPPKCRYLRVEGFATTSIIRRLLISSLRSRSSIYIKDVQMPMRRRRGSK